MLGSDQVWDTKLQSWTVWDSSRRQRLRNHMLLAFCIWLAMHYSFNHAAWEGVDKTNGWHRSVQWRERWCELTWTYIGGFFHAYTTAFLLAIGSVRINWGKSNIILICSYHYVVVKLMYVCLICWIFKVILGATGLTGCMLAYLSKKKGSFATFSTLLHYRT